MLEAFQITEVLSLDSHSKIRYFKTPYKTFLSDKTLIHYNDQGNFPSRNWVINQIKTFNNNDIVAILETIEISYTQFQMEMLKVDANQEN